MIGDFPIMVVTHILCILAKNVIQCTVARVHVLPYHIIFYTGEIGLEITFKARYLTRKCIQSLT